MLLIALLVAVAAAKPQFGTDEAIGSAVGSVINTATGTINAATGAALRGATGNIGLRAGGSPTGAEFAGVGPSLEATAAGAIVGAFGVAAQGF